jgi:hypothetical protein
MVNDDDQIIMEALREILTESLVEESWKFRSVRKPKMSYREKDVKVDGKRHRAMLQRTLEHLTALRNVYHPNSSNRHILSQACTRIRRLLKQLEKTTDMDSSSGRLY